MSNVELFHSNLFQCTIQCGNPKYASLQNKVFIGTSRYHITEKGMAVEWTHFEVVPVPQSA